MVGFLPLHSTWGYYGFWKMPNNRCYRYMHVLWAWLSGWVSSEQSLQKAFLHGRFTREWSLVNSVWGEGSRTAQRRRLSKVWFQLKPSLSLWSHGEMWSNGSIMELSSTEPGEEVVSRSRWLQVTLRKHVTSQSFLVEGYHSSSLKRDAIAEGIVPWLSK